METNISDDRIFAKSVNFFKTVNSHRVWIETNKVHAFDTNVNTALLVLTTSSAKAVVLYDGQETRETKD